MPDVRRKPGSRLGAAACVAAALALHAATSPPLLAAPQNGWRASITPEAQSQQQPVPQGVKLAATHKATATAAALTGDAKRTTFRLELSDGVTAEIFTLADPYRVVVDLPDVAFDLTDGTGKDGLGLIKAFRYGLFAEHKARIVIDTNGPVRVEHAAMTATGETSVSFTFDIVATAPESFGQGTGPNRSDKPAAQPMPEADPHFKPKPHGKPVIIIDPGHGGIDGGAVGARNLLEKDIVLAVAKELRGALAAGHRYDVQLTRSTDVFISLDHRVSHSIKSGAELFISLHADSLGEPGSAQAIRGATVYTLSDRASDEQARLMAEKENASDLVAGLASANGEAADQLKNILIDLLKRETANFSKDFSNVLVRQLKRKIMLSRDPQRAAAFKVLKQTHSPSVLVELGYLSNFDDEQLLCDPAWQKQAASSIAAAVDDYFLKRNSGSR
ncbi:MAG: N-acetylmuramoyl-L-alanine amidase [Hyphomicrobium sp.]